VPELGGGLVASDPVASAAELELRSASDNCQLLELFVCELDHAIRQDGAGAGRECAVDTVFKEGSSVRASNIDLLQQAILACGTPKLREQVEPESDTGLLLDVLRAELSVENAEYVNFIKLIEWELVPLLQIDGQKVRFDTAEARTLQFRSERLRTVAALYSEDQLYFTQEAQELWEIQTRLNLNGEAEVLKFQMWQVERLGAMSSLAISN